MILSIGKTEQNIILTEQLANSYNEPEIALEYNKVIKSIQAKLCCFMPYMLAKMDWLYKRLWKKLSSKGIKRIKGYYWWIYWRNQKFDSKNANKYLKNLEELQASYRNWLELLMAEYRSCNWNVVIVTGGSTKRIFI